MRNSGIACCKIEPKELKAGVRGLSDYTVCGPPILASSTEARRSTVLRFAAEGPCAVRLTESAGAPRDVI